MPQGPLQASNLNIPKEYEQNSFGPPASSEPENLQHLANMSRSSHNSESSFSRRSRSRTKLRNTEPTPPLKPIVTSENITEEDSPRDSLLGGGKSEKKPIKGSTSLKVRARSISPHARAILSRTFSRSRSRSISRSRHALDDDGDDSSMASVDSSTSGRGSQKQLLVAVTSCRSDAYHAQKAPGATSMLPRKAPSALKIFHELAVGVKDAYEAMGATPVKPDEESEEFRQIPFQEQIGRKVLWEFNGNLNFVSDFVVSIYGSYASCNAPHF